MSDGSPAIYLHEQASLDDPFEATRQTVQYMCRLIEHSLSDPIVAAAADDARRRFGRLVGSTDGFGAAACCWWWAHLALEFSDHQQLLGVWLHKFDELQLLISPEALLKMRKPQGDCAVYTTLICAMLQACGVKWEIVTAAVNPKQPGIFSHVYPRAVMNGRRLVLDASHGKYPGWEVPRERQSARQVWDGAGNPIADQDQDGPSGFQGLHGVPNMRRGVGCCGRGMGQTDISSPDYNPNDTAEGLSFISQALQPTDSFSSYSTPSVDTSSAASLLGQLSTMWTKALAPAIGQSIAPTTQYVRNADGSLSIIAPGSSPVLGTSLLSGTTGSSSLLWIGAAGLVLVFMLSRK